MIIYKIISVHILIGQETQNVSEVPNHNNLRTSFNKSIGN